MTFLTSVKRDWIPREKRKRGRPRKTWMAGVQAAMTTRNLEPDQWRNREEWRLVYGRRRQLLKNRMGGWMDGWVGGWMDGWMDQRFWSVVFRHSLLKSVYLSSVFVVYLTTLLVYSVGL